MKMLKEGIAIIEEDGSITFSGYRFDAKGDRFLDIDEMVRLIKDRELTLK